MVEEGVSVTASAGMAGDDFVTEILDALISLAHGDFSARLVPGTDGGELDAVRVSINVVAEELEAQFAEVSAARDGLRAEVQARTAELAWQARILESVLENMETGVVVADPDRRFVVFNRAAREILGVSPSAVTPDEWPYGDRLYSPDDGSPVPMDDLPIAMALQGKAVDRVELLVRRPGSPGETIISVTGRPILDADGAVRAGVVVFEDVTRRREAERSQGAADRRMEAALATAAARARELGILAELSNMLQAAETTEELFGVVGASMADLFGGRPGTLYMYSASRDELDPRAGWGPVAGRRDVDAILPASCWALRRGRPHMVTPSHQQPCCEHVTACPAGGYICVPVLAHGEVLALLHVEDLVGDDGEEAARSPAVAEEAQRLAVTAGEYLGLGIANLRLREELRWQSIRDPLTGWHNRRFMMESLRREISRARRQMTTVAVLMLDIDSFKAVNDEFGHDAGDRTLVAFTATIRRHLRDSDVACRFGGEEFVIVMPDMDPRCVARRAEEIRALAATVPVAAEEEVRRSITVSIGVALYPDAGDEVADLLRVADRALYAAKRAGKDRVVVAGAAAAEGAPPCPAPMPIGDPDPTTGV